jgi:hypothetical protein
MKTKYKLVLYFDNGDGQYKIIGVKEGKDMYDHISRKHDKVLDPDRGTIEVSGDIHHMRDVIEVDYDYELTWEERQEWEPEDD